MEFYKCFFHLSIPKKHGKGTTSVTKIKRFPMVFLKIDYICS
ncbi:hypothetical protein BACCOPRO_00857 [Phocaeicola coprophilus DSM 18228 = JCM 13818]|uniref:Uncharacterized protein n=1 Tax=Phocaeicola coprophilus DSM 18228 = JCM 13818 TaxID=547042 RepID=S0F5C4_9BACT|nr:hypothetical protein BACCOPRO_00857 [Phocaeicola coprophilus DSM 18228 = JCM 13818]